MLVPAPMKTTPLLVIAAALAVGCVHADRWQPHQIALEGAFLAADYIDMRQTERITAHGTEGNPFIGSRGQNMPPTMWFPVTALLHLALAHVLPSAHRSWMLGASAGVEWKTVQRNYIVGDGLW